MNSGEFLPIVSGILLGSTLNLFPPSWRKPMGLALAVLLGFVFTVASGEFRASWSYLLVDTASVSASAFLALRLSLIHI